MLRPEVPTLRELSLAARRCLQDKMSGMVSFSSFVASALICIVLVASVSVFEKVAGCVGSSFLVVLTASYKIILPAAEGDEVASTIA